MGAGLSCPLYKMKITAIRLDEFGVGRYRITNPLTELEKRGHSCNIIQAEYGLRMRSDWFHGNILLCQRMNDEVIYRLVNSIPEPNRPLVVYEIDDLLWGENKTQQGKDLTKDWQRTVPPMIRRASGVTCSTPELARRCEEFNSRVYVSRNGIDLDLRDWTGTINRPPGSEGKVIIGWSGGGWHQGDLDVIGKALRLVMLRYPETLLVLQGDAPNIALWVQKLNIPPKRMCVIDWMPLDEHPSIYSIFDIGIAPLANTPYNRCKSELKLMELGARSLPYVASAVAPYRRFHGLSGGKCGFLASTETDWYGALSSLVETGELRKSMGQFGYQFVSNNYTLKQQADDLEWALRDVMRANSRMGVYQNG